MSTDPRYRPCNHECNGCPTCDAGRAPTTTDEGDETDG